MAPTATTTVAAIAARRGLPAATLATLDPTTPLVLHHERAHDLTLTLPDDPRIFRVYAGRVQIIHPDGQVAAQIIDRRFHQTLPAPVLALAGLLSAQVWRTAAQAAPRTRAAQLRFLAATVQDAGWYRTPDGLYLAGGGFAYYWSCPRPWVQHGFTQADWDRLATFSARYRRLAHYVREVAPQWREERRIAWADNAIDVVEVNRFGHRRTRQVIGPGGDACF